jgi:PncC family amidohydrolase
MRTSGNSARAASIAASSLARSRISRSFRRAAADRRPARSARRAEDLDRLVLGLLGFLDRRGRAVEGPGDHDQLGDLDDRIDVRALDEALVAVGDDTLAGVTARLLTAAGVTVALAESCTGGLIAKLLTDQPGSSAFFERGAVTYANSAKAAWLGVPADLLESHGAVSAECARAMAKGVRRAAGTDLGLAVTGIAGPDGGSAEKPVGTVFIALATGRGERVEGFHFRGDRGQVRLHTACSALDWLRRQAIAQMDGDAGRPARAQDR